MRYSDYRWYKLYNYCCLSCSLQYYNSTCTVSIVSTAYTVL